MANDWIEPTEALRIFIGVAVQGNPGLADTFVRGWWFDHPKSAVQSGLCTDLEFRAVVSERDRFYEARRAGKIRASGVFNGEGRREPIDPADIARGTFNVRQSKLDCSISGRAKREWLDVLLSRQDVEGLTGRARSKGGRPTAADWDAVEEAFRIEVRQRGLPDKENVKGWQTQNDVIKWMRNVLKARHEHAELTALKTHARKMIRRAEKDASAKTRTKT